MILDEVFLGGAESQQRVRAALSGLSVFWVAVRCDVEVAVAREAVRTDRVAGMVRSQDRIVHEGVEYDLQVDTSHTTAGECAAEIAAVVGHIATPPPL